MLRTRPLLALTCVALALPIALLPTHLLAAAAGQTETGWITLFDGTSLEGWRGYRQPDASATRWRARDGMLRVPPRLPQDPRAVDIITTETYDRFELSFDWRVEYGGNSGVKYFVLEDHNSAIGHEYQILDDERHGDAKIGRHRQTASFYDVLPPSVPRSSPAFKPAGEWNTGAVHVVPSRSVPGGTSVYHYLNGVRVLEYELDSPELREAIAKSKFKDVPRFGKLQKGHILLQDHNDDVSFRNVRIRPLPASQSQLASGAEAGPGRTRFAGRTMVARTSVSE